MSKTLLVTGGAGFIGANFIQYMLDTYADTYTIINCDALTYAGNLENLSSVETLPNYQFCQCDITEKTQLEKEVFEKYAIDSVVHFAAESHVDRSIDDSSHFTKTNVLGTQVLLDCAKKYKTQRFIHVSTDEVYGTLGKEGVFTENTSLAPNSPYAASKAASDLMARAYHQTHELPVIITRCSNNYGPYQFPEKLIPLMITNALNDDPLPVYGKGDNIRDWLHVLDHCRAIDAVLHEGQVGEVYNIGGGTELSNLELVKELLRCLDKPESLITYVTDRPGHDFRYAISSEKLKKDLGWEASIPFSQGLQETIDWYCSNKDWWESIKSGAYQSYYDRHYKELK
ncbi:dTDP-glucose 4,6-dehydratase [Candidatus Marinamargulisbacteria bacterium SCGC AG-439-L15]|nr:dTDP-glucose 4,6-dehydratase [Candidatus Marinamargulisbacteria bacterium SCGC AG-439-L15]